MDQQHNYSTCFSSSTKIINVKDQKKKKNKGSSMKLSTDPQSVAARERRHRISDRFKILQSLVPGGSKMDTATMLEEAIHYVKFLKTQIWVHQTMINNYLVDQNYSSYNYDHHEMMECYNPSSTDLVENTQMKNNNNLMDLQVPSYNNNNNNNYEAFQQVDQFPFSDGEYQFRGEETNISGDAFMY